MKNAQKSSRTQCAGAVAGEDDVVGEDAHAVVEGLDAFKAEMVRRLAENQDTAALVHRLAEHAAHLLTVGKDLEQGGYGFSITCIMQAKKPLTALSAMRLPLR